MFVLFDLETLGGEKQWKEVNGAPISEGKRRLPS